MPEYKIHVGDCLDVLKTMPDNSVDSIVTDPPYGLSKEPDMVEVLRHWLAGDDYQHKGGGFMGKKWDSFVPGPAVWREALRVLKPGGHLLAFFGTRTHDMGTLAIRLAGFEIRDMGAWLCGSGFPKSMDVSKAIDQAAGAEREVVGFDEQKARKQTCSAGTSAYGDYGGSSGDITAPATESARQWQGWGTALKPAHEPITFARKPLAKGHTVAANVLEHGTGALNIGGCRVGTDDNLNGGAYSETDRENPFFKGLDAGGGEFTQPPGRWPANILHDGSDEVLALFPNSKSCSTPSSARPVGKILGGARSQGAIYPGEDGSAARFFYCAKASRKDRNEGMADPGPQFERGTTLRQVENTDTKGNNHPTVKPTDLMAYLCRLVTPPGGVVLDPFMGSGSTGKAAMREGFRFIGCELSEEYAAIARARIEHARQQVDPDPLPEPEPANDNEPALGGQLAMF